MIEKQNIKCKISEIIKIIDFLKNVEKDVDFEVNNELVRMYITYLMDEIFDDKYKKNW